MILAAIIALAQPAFAAQPPCIDPQYTNVQRAYVSMTIDGSGKAKIALYVNGKTGLKNTDVTTHLEKKVGNSWMPVKDFQYSTSSKSFTKSYEEKLSSTGQYRAVAEFTFTAATIEYVTDTSSATY